MRKTGYRPPPISTHSEEPKSLQHLVGSTLHPQNRQAVPIKQYSNKFFREFQHNQLVLSSTPKIQYQKRANTLLRKKKLIIQTPRRSKISSEISQIVTEVSQKSIMAMSSFSKRKRERAVTEGPRNSIYQQNTQNSIIQLENQLVVSQNFSPKLFSPSESILPNNHTQPLDPKAKKKSSTIFKQFPSQKISQSRGLQLFSKLYVKQRSQMVEKLKQSSGHIKKGISKQISHQNQNHFETKKIYPMEKCKKRQHLIKCLDQKRKITRTPMRLLQNSLISCYNTLQKQQVEAEKDDFFELNGWQTTI